MFSHQYDAGQLQIGRAFRLFTVGMSEAVAVRSPSVLKAAPPSLLHDSSSTYIQELRAA